jgi:hypothetical protein
MAPLIVSSRVHTSPSLEETISVDPTPYHLPSFGDHVTRSGFPLVHAGVAAAVNEATGAVKLLEIVPLTPRFISVGFVMFVDNAAPLFITRIFFVVPAAVAALA